MKLWRFVKSFQKELIDLGLFALGFSYFCALCWVLGRSVRALGWEVELSETGAKFPNFATGMIVTAMLLVVAVVLFGGWKLGKYIWQKWKHA